jgi:peroxiredoxin
VGVPKPVVATFVVLAVGLISFNIALVKQDAKLAAMNKAYEANLHLSAGAKVPPLSGSAADGTPTVITYSSVHPKTLLLVYARSCPACALNWLSWQELLNRVDLTRVRPIAVSVEGDGLSTQYLKQVGLTKVEAALLPDFESILLYRLRYTPQTILIDSNSKVEGIWSGVLNPRQVTEIAEETVSSDSNSLADEKTAKPN